MTLEEFNALRPGDKVFNRVYECTGTVLFEWGKDHPSRRKDAGYAVRIDSGKLGHDCEDAEGVARVPEGNGWNLWRGELGQWSVTSLKDQLAKLWETALP